MPADYEERVQRLAAVLPEGADSDSFLPLHLRPEAWPDLVEVVVGENYEGLFRGGVLLESSHEQIASIAAAGLRLQVASGANRQYSKAITFAKRAIKAKGASFVLLRRNEVEIIAQPHDLAVLFSRAYAVIGAV